MLKIGDFSKLARVSVKALHLYDQIGLLRPAHVDSSTHYRYYSVDQLPRLNRILAFKDLGLSLEQIGKLLEDSIPVAELWGMLQLKQAQLRQQLDEDQARLARVEARLQQIEQEDFTMTNYDVVLKKVEPMQVASLRESLPSYFAIGRLFEELLSHMDQHHAQPGDYCAAIWHDPDYKEQDVDGEAVVALLSGSVPNTDKIKTYQLPGVETMACTIHKGSYLSLKDAYAALFSWIDSSGYRVVGPNREFYIHGGNVPDDASYITELQFPVAKNA